MGDTLCDKRTQPSALKIPPRIDPLTGTLRGAPASIIVLIERIEINKELFNDARTYLTYRKNIYSIY